MTVPVAPLPTARPVRARPRTQDGFTIIEVVIAVLLLAIIASGMAIAMAGSSHSLNAAKVASRKAATAGRIADVIRNERGWIDTCKQSGGSTCNLDSGAYSATSSAIRAKLVDGSLGKACSSGSDFSFQLDKAEVKKVDSNVDGVGAADTDHRVPDYYTITVIVSIPSCDTTRLAAASAGSSTDAMPYLYSTSIDEAGRKLTGGLTVQACRITNQVDERMSLDGCASGTSAIQMAPCAPSTNPMNPDVGCEDAMAWAHTTAAPASPNVRSDWMTLARTTTSFSLSGPGISVGSGSGHMTPSGLVFDNLPAGAYKITGVAIPGGMELWQTKMIPASNGLTGGYLTVQPDVTSRALITFRPKRVGTLRLNMQHRDRYYHAVKHTTGLVRRKTKIPTKSFSGDKSVFTSEVNEVRTDFAKEGKATFTSCGIEVTTCGYTKDTFLDTVTPLVENLTDNCYRADWNNIHEDWRTNLDPPPAGDLSSGPGIVYSSFDNPMFAHACTWYDLDADYTYYTPSYDGFKDFPGAVADGSYALAPAASYRDVATPADATDAMGGCGAPFTGTALLEIVNATCVAGRSTATATIRDISTGLNTRLKSSNTLVTTTRTYDTSTHTWDTYGNNYSVDANDNISHALPAWTSTRGVWVSPSGTFTGSSGTLPSTINMLGFGKCFWNGGAAGPCGDCNIVIPGKGTVHGCNVLTHVHWRRCGYMTAEASGAWADRFDTHTRDCYEGDKDVLEVCSGAPAGGNENNLAPNCSAASVSSPPGGHSGGYSGSGSNGGAVSSTTFSNVTAQPSSGSTSVGTG